MLYVLVNQNKVAILWQKLIFKRQFEKKNHFLNAKIKYDARIINVIK